MSRRPETNPHFAEITTRHPPHPDQSSQAPPLSPGLQTPRRRQSESEPPVSPWLPPQWDRGQRSRPQETSRMGLPHHEQFNPAWYLPPQHHQSPDHRSYTPSYPEYDGSFPPPRAPRRGRQHHSPAMLLPHHVNHEEHEDHGSLGTPRHDHEHSVAPKHNEQYHASPPILHEPDQHEEHYRGPLVPNRPTQGKETLREQPQEHKHMLGYRVPKQTRTRPITWLAAVCCAILWIAIFIAGLMVLIIYLVYRPQNPIFTVSSATLNSAYIDSGSLLNADLTMLANFTNPNKKVTVEFSSTILELYYGRTLISSQYISAFSEAKSKSLFANVRMATSQVQLPVLESQRMLQELNRNAVIMDVKGAFHVTSNFGRLLRYSYRVYGHCKIMLASPPAGVLRDTRCRMKH